MMMMRLRPHQGAHPKGGLHRCRRSPQAGFSPDQVLACVLAHTLAHTLSPPSFCSIPNCASGERQHSPTLGYCGVCGAGVCGVPAAPTTGQASACWQVCDKQRWKSGRGWSGQPNHLCCNVPQAQLIYSHVSIYLAIYAIHIYPDAVFISVFIYQPPPPL